MIKSKILITRGMVWLVSSDKWKAPLGSFHSQQERLEYWKSRTESPNYNTMPKLSGQPSVSQKRRFLQGRGQQQRATATVVTKHIIFMSKKRRELIEIYRS